MIRSFSDKQTGTIFNRGQARKLPPEILKRAKRKLLLIHTASSLDDLKVPPGNRLEQHSGDRLGQWRICFEWHESDAYNIEIVNYH
ncbi:type II toxin-antitoxin system RelE/ParE family toxin [Fodinibius sediminis]|uniref:Proteic killer suppression protein n=1 Tax=Fodinibius sediminis TaxID=1214077 RepID=A0A521AJC6_9BACT|nr:type II toxin-antitoxin system RelE/ParE family toxin [Fodinibius sediminis]SMO34780.1 proteic killer suppression protein [Fodinibius sediminis]